MTLPYSKMGRRNSLEASAAITYPETSIGLIDGPGAEMEVAQATLRDLPAVGSKVRALRMVGGGNVHERDEEGESWNREYEYDHQCKSPCRCFQFSIRRSNYLPFQVFGAMRCDYS